ncbi:MAG: hypothetical protein JXO22_12360 [Phycisphaerae bacterium]|nr:hypothetical protein [Phycisphaerae bacterium]
MENDTSPPTESASETGGSGSSSPDVSVNPAGLLDVHLRQTALSDALRMLSQQSRRNISIAAGVEATVSTDLYQVTFEEALEALLTSAGYAWFSKGSFIYVCSPEQRDAMVMAGRNTELRMFELDFITAQTAEPLVKDLLSPAGTIVTTAASPVPGVAMTPEDFDQALNDGLGGKSRAIGEFIIVRDYPDVLDQVAEVIGRLDTCPRQVLVEALILRARLDETNALGIDFNTLSGVDFRSINSASTGGTTLTTGAVPPVEFDEGLGAIDSSVSADIPAGGISVGVITNNAAVFVRAIEEIVDLTIVANPKILTVNEQLGRVIVGREDGYLTSTVTETATIQDVEFLQTGTQILFRPFITRDGFVRMDIHPEDSSGGLTPDNLPYKDTTELTTNIMLEDGHTLVIGGLFREVVTSNRTQLPWLGNIPVVGNLFRGSIDRAVREEVIVLITPHIIDGGADYERAAWASDEVERRRTLAHRGLLPWGRERLAQAHYQWALEHHRAERLDAARWDLDLAIALNPRFIEASQLRDQLTGDVTTEPDNSVVRHILRQMAADTANPGEMTDITSDGETP